MGCPRRFRERAAAFAWFDRYMSALARPQKITFGEMRSSGVHGVLIYCANPAAPRSPACHAEGNAATYIIALPKREVQAEH